MGKGRAILREFRHLLPITLACAVYSAAWTAFILPYGIVSGGVAGLSSLLYYVAHIPASLSYAVVNALLFIVALKLLGWKFFANSIYATVAITFFLWVGERLLTDPATGDLIRILEDERFMAMLIGCTICGLSVAALFACSGSSGGTDIIAAIANKYFGVSIGVCLIVIDLFIIGSGLFIPSLGSTLERVRFVAFGFCAMGVECMTISYALNVRRRSVQFMIFTRRHDEIAKAISDATGHTMTLLDAHGWYTGDEMKVVCVLAKMSESNVIFRIIHSIDPRAFVSQSRVIGVWGEGFDEMKGLKHA
ncbi:MAG: YitT family protein [Kiritimatiellae bacterium]|nr:YitT family protein [Kiritimatiellia bacterium]MBR4476917.1 YitT family protein [Kiritimatiellia bacterium]